MPLLHWLTSDADIHAATHAPYRLLEESPGLFPWAWRHRQHADPGRQPGHAQWLAMMYPRLELLWSLLAEDGSIWVTIDDNEAHYLEGEQGGISEAVGWKGGGGFRFYRLGVPVFDETGHIAPGVRFAPLAAHLWFIETGLPFSGDAVSPLLGTHEGTGYYLLYNGILGDKKPNGGNVLTSKTLALLPPFGGPKVIFGEACRLGEERLRQEGISFRQIPYEIKAR